MNERWRGRGVYMLEYIIQGGVNESLRGICIRVYYTGVGE